MRPSFPTLSVLLTVAACSGRESGAPPPPDAGPSPGPDAAVEIISTPAGATCRWIGYGIGPSDHGQCDRQHLMAHAARECWAGHGSPVAEREIAGHCQGEAEEVQFSCCFTGALPAPEALAIADSTLINQRFFPAPDETREALVARAGQACTAAGSQLGDWSIIYDAGGVAPALLRFSCLSGAPVSDNASVRVSGRAVQFQGLDQVKAECVGGHKGLGAQLGDDRLHLNVFAAAPGRYRCDDAAPVTFLGWESAGLQYQLNPGQSGGSCELDIEEVHPRFRGTFTATLPRLTDAGPDQIGLSDGTFDVTMAGADCP